MLPTITIGGEEFYDITGIVQPPRAPRPSLIGLGIHHSVGQQDFADLNQSGTNMDEEIAHIKAIDAYHVRVGYGGFGYNGIGFASGRGYVVGDGKQQRAGIYRRNHEIENFCLAGDFSIKTVPLGLVLIAARWVKAKWAQHGVELPVKGHMQWALPESPTSCPGAVGLASVPTIVAAARNLRDRPDLIARQVRQRITAALQPAWAAGDIETLARQIAFISGGKLCG